VFEITGTQWFFDCFSFFFWPKHAKPCGYLDIEEKNPKNYHPALEETRNPACKIC
jgi:hypothetical protein